MTAVPHCFRGFSAVRRLDALGTLKDKTTHAFRNNTA